MLLLILNLNHHLKILIKEDEPSQQVKIDGDEINISSKDGNYKMFQQCRWACNYTIYKISNGTFDNLVLTTGNPLEYVKLANNSLASPNELCVYWLELPLDVENLKEKI